MTQPTHSSCLVAVVVAGALLTACGGGSGAEFIEACLKEGSSAASKALDQEMGVTRQKFCECGEPIARSSLSADAYRAMVLDMQGKTEEASAITSKMSESEQMAALTILPKMIQQCRAN